jgi:hypothetical protein
MSGGSTIASVPEQLNNTPLDAVSHQERVLAWVPPC